MEASNMEMRLALIEKQVETNSKLIEEIKTEREERIRLSIQVEGLKSTVEELNGIIEQLKENISSLERKPGDFAVKSWQYICSLVVSAGVGAILTAITTIL